jgi:hypothetical protein
LDDAHEQTGLELRSFATTLLVVAIAGDWVATGHTGDGGVVGWTAGGQLLTLSPPEQEEYVNVVRPLTAETGVSHGRYAARRLELSGLALFSDGMQRLVLSGPAAAPHEPFWRPFIAALCGDDQENADGRVLEEFLGSERVSSRSDDDRTMLVLCHDAAGDGDGPAGTGE